MKHPSPSVQEASERVADHMDKILGYFKPGRKITVLVRSPEHPDGSQDFVLTNDTLDETIAALTIRKTAPTLRGDV